MHRIRKRLTYANVMSSIAVFLLVGGATAFAATQLPKNSVGTKQLKKNAVNSAKVKDGSLKAVDFKAGQLPSGPQGPKGDPGPQGEPGPLVETLPSGKTERGTYAFASTRASGGSKYTPGTVLSFPIPLSFTPSIHKIAIAGPPTSECPGTREDPRATPGNLCFYEGRNDGFELFPEIDVAKGRLGVTLFFGATEGSNYEFWGSWAVTAP